MKRKKKNKHITLEIKQNGKRNIYYISLIIKKQQYKIE